jgi:hypothetical protein
MLLHIGRKFIIFLIPKFILVTGTIIDQSLENSTWLPPFIMLVLFEDQPSAIPQLVELGVGDLLHLKVKWMSKLEK